MYKMNTGNNSISQSLSKQMHLGTTCEPQWYVKTPQALASDLYN